MLKESRENPIKIITSIGDAELFMVGKMQWEIVYPWGEEDYYFGLLGHARHWVKRRIQEYEKSNQAA